MNITAGENSAHRVIVFSPDTPCVQCNATYRKLDAEGIVFEKVTVSADDDTTREQLKALGFAQFPVVWVEGAGYWSGFNPGKIEEIKSGAAA